MAVENTGFSAVLRLLVAGVVFCTTVLTANGMPYQDENEYSFVAMQVVPRSSSQYLDGRSIPNVYLSELKSSNGSLQQPLVRVLRNRSGSVVHEFSRDNSISVLASARYEDKAYILIKRSWTSGGEMHSESCLFDDTGNSQLFAIDCRPLTRASLDATLTVNGELALLTRSGVAVINRSGRTVLSVESPSVLVHGDLANHPDGTLMALAVDESNMLQGCDFRQWLAIPLMLAPHGDRVSVMRVFPFGKVLYGAVYRYINEYNKGLYLVQADFGSDQSCAKVLFNSAVRNVGFDPDLYVAGGSIVVSARDSSSGNDASFAVPLASFPSMPEIPPAHTIGFEGEKSVHLNIGGGVSLLSWVTKSEVSKNDVTYMSVDYELPDSVFYTGRIEGRIDNVQLAVVYLQNYIQNQVEDAAEDHLGHSTAGKLLLRRASYRLYGALDFSGFLSPSSNLRLIFENSEFNGMAKVTRDGNQSEPEAFTSRYTRGAGWIMLERGFYIGVESVKYSMPAAVGYEDAWGRVAAYYDPQLEIQKISAIIGYDTLSYAKRYETDFAKWYVDGSMGIGFGWLKVSSEYARDAEYRLGAAASKPLIGVFDGTLEIGYIVQKRLRSLKGAGLQIKGGYRGRGAFMFSTGQGDQKNSEKLDVIFSKSDLFHGAFAEMSLIF